MAWETIIRDLARRWFSRKEARANPRATDASDLRRAERAFDAKVSAMADALAASEGQNTATLVDSHLRNMQPAGQALQSCMEGDPADVEGRLSAQLRAALADIAARDPVTIQRIRDGFDRAALVAVIRAAGEKKFVSELPHHDWGDPRQVFVEQMAAAVADAIEDAGSSNTPHGP